MGQEWERAPTSPCCARPDRDGQLLQGPPTAGQLEQQQQEVRRREVRRARKPGMGKMTMRA
jgi:hypothetical protein